MKGGNMSEEEEEEEEEEGCWWRAALQRSKPERAAIINTATSPLILPDLL